MTSKKNLQELAVLFLKLGTIAFGGPAAHTAMMEDEVVHRRQWLSRQEFLDLMGATNLIPGPNSTELAIHIGHRHAGWPGLLVAGISFILPAMVIVMAFGWLYVEYGKLPQVQNLLYGIKPVIIAVITQALWKLSNTAVKSRLLGWFGFLALVMVWLGIHELIILFGLGFLTIMMQGLGKKNGPYWLFTPWFSWIPSSTHVNPIASFGLWPLFFFFLKVGSVLFGSGYVLLAFLQADLVDRWGWLTQQQLLDAIAVGQITPGPVFTTATFIGYILAGPTGAIVATLGIFLPAFIFVALSSPFISRMRASKPIGAFLDGLNMASLALMASVTISLARGTLIDGFTVILTLLSGVALIYFKVNSAWLVLAGGLLGLLFV